MSVCVCVSAPLELELQTGASWELNPGPLEEQSALLTAEPSFQACDTFFVYIYMSICLSSKASHKLPGGKMGNLPCQVPDTTPQNLTGFTQQNLQSELRNGARTRYQAS